MMIISNLNQKSWPWFNLSYGKYTDLDVFGRIQSLLTYFVYNHAVPDTVCGRVQSLLTYFVYYHAVPDTVSIRSHPTCLTMQNAPLLKGI